MNQATVLETSSSEDSELHACIAQCLTEIDQMREQMSRDDAEIARSRKRSRALLAEIKATLSAMNPKAA